jgi:O-antigen/teichoic acid export membrane protein
MAARLPGGAPALPAGHGTDRRLTGRASLNAVASGLEYGVRAIVELIVSPLLVSGLGTQLYGAWRVLWQWTSYVWGASGRSAQALQFAIANRQFTATTDEKRQLVGAAVVVWLLFTPLVVSVGALGVWLAPGFLDVPAGEVTGLRIAASVLVLDALAVTLLTLPRSTLQGENLGYTRMVASPVLVVVGGALLVVAVKLDLGLPGVAGATLATTFLTAWVFWRITRRRLPWFGVSRPPRQVIRWFLGLSMWFLGWKLVLELMIASDILVLAAFASLTVVAAFALTKFVTDSLAQALSMLVQATIPGIGGHLGAGRLTRAAALRGEVIALVWAAGAAIGTTVVVWNASFVGLWVGDDLFAGTSATLLLVVLALQVALIRTDTFLIDVALVPRVKVLAGSVAAVASIVLAAVAIGPLDLGVLGMCVGLVAGRAVLSLAAPVAVGRVLGVPLSRQVRAVLRPLLATGALLAAGFSLSSRVAVDGWLPLVLGVALTTPLAAVAAVALGLDGAQRRRLTARVRVLVHQARGVR